jgi:hypothetical protein
VNAKLPILPIAIAVSLRGSSISCAVRASMQDTPDAIAKAPIPLIPLVSAVSLRGSSTPCAVRASMQDNPT